MTLYLISCDLKKTGKNYSRLYEAIKKFGNWCHYLESTWIIETEDSADEIWEELEPYVDEEDDRVLVIEAGEDMQGWLPDKAWDWIEKNE